MEPGQRLNAESTLSIPRAGIRAAVPHQSAEVPVSLLRASFCRVGAELQPVGVRLLRTGRPLSAIVTALLAAFTCIPATLPTPVHHDRMDVFLSLALGSQRCQGVAKVPGTERPNG